MKVILYTMEYKILFKMYHHVMLDCMNLYRKDNIFFLFERILESILIEY